MRGQLAQIVLPNRLATPCAEGLRAGRSAVDQDEPHVPPSNEKRVGSPFDRNLPIWNAAINCTSVVWHTDVVALPKLWFTGASRACWADIKD